MRQCHESLGGLYNIPFTKTSAVTIVGALLSQCARRGMFVLLFLYRLI